MTAFVVDVGSWFRAQRATQSTVDAGRPRRGSGAPWRIRPQPPPWQSTMGRRTAAASPARTSRSRASTHRTTRSGNLDDEVRARVSSHRSSGSASVTVEPHASAMVGVPSEAQYVAPIAVNILHPDLSGPGCPCFGPGNETVLPLGKTGAPGAFDLINLNQDQTNWHRRREHARRLDPERLYSAVPPARRLLLRPGRKVQREPVPGRPRRASRHRPPLSRLRHIDRLGIERDLSRDRLGRLPSPEWRHPRQQRDTDWVLHQGDLAGAPAGLRSRRHP